MSQEKPSNELCVAERTIAEGRTTATTQRATIALSGGGSCETKSVKKLQGAEQA